MACASEQNVAHQYTGFIFSSEDAILKSIAYGGRIVKISEKEHGQNIVQDKTIFLWLYAILFSDTAPLTGECVTKWVMLLFWEHDHGFGSKIRAHNMAKNTDHFILWVTTKNPRFVKKTFWTMFNWTVYFPQRIHFNSNMFRTTLIPKTPKLSLF